MKPQKLGNLSNKNWSKFPLKTLLITPIRNGYSPVCPDQESSIWVLALSALDGNGFDSSQKKPAPPDDRKVREFLISKGDFLVSRSNTFDKVGRSALVREAIENCAYPDLMMRFRVDEKKVCLEYLDNYLRSEHVRRYFQGCAAGSHASMVKITKTILEETQILLPSLPEQEKIASFLGSIDSRLTQLRRKHELLQTYKRGVMQKIFSQELRFKSDDGSEFPDWEEKKLGRVASFFSGGTPTSTNTAYYTGKIPFIKSGEISAEITAQFLSTEGLENSSAKMVEVGDLLYALYGATSGEVAISKIKGAINQAVLCIRSTVHETAFLMNFLKTSKITIIGKYLQGGQGNLSAEIIKKLIIPIPCREEQNKIVNFLAAIDKKIEAVAQQIERTEQFKKGLLQKMFV